MNPVVSFAPFGSEHVALLLAWLKRPHVAEFWQEAGTEREIAEKFLSKLPGRGFCPFIILLGGRPAGYIQYYEACTAGGGWWEGYPPGVFGMDQFLGEEGDLGKGIGTGVLIEFVRFVRERTGAREVIVDPEPGNLRAIRAYEKAGFVKHGLITTPNGEAMLMKWKLSGGDSA
jgi:RimJ/RimL family protein N-acetyltransferase